MDMMPLRQKLVFIVEDNEMYSFMLDYLLSQEHLCRCVRFEKGEECLRSMDLNPELIILDYMLPGINGLETLKRIRKTNTSVPVLVLTNHYSNEMAKVFLEEGAYDYKMKESDGAGQVKNLVGKVLEAGSSPVKKIRIGKNDTNSLLKALVLVLSFLTLSAGIAWMLYS